MKNDPHVTEVSDDGALLKRYRNEIVDLKRRLHEASVFDRVCHILLSPSLPAVLQLCFEPSPAGFFSHTDHSDREEGSLPAAPRKGPAPEGTRGQDPKSDETTRHQL